MLTMMTEIIARTGSPSQLMRPVMRPSRKSVQLMTLKVGSNIHFQANVDSTVGMMKGSRMKARVKRLAAEVAVEQQVRATGQAQV